MIKRRLETVEDARHHIGCRKRAHLQNIVSHLYLMEFQSLTSSLIRTPGLFDQQPDAPSNEVRYLI